MAIHFPDLSHYDLDRGVVITAGTPAVIAKATHGTHFLDPAYSAYKRQAAAAGAYWTAYHWLNHGNAAMQARYTYAAVGTVPTMVDAEDMPNNTGYNGALTVADIADYVTGLRRAGGISNLVYLPHWYWADHMGSPDLTPLRDLGLYLVSSNYRTYSDTGAGWDGYGGMTVVQWQYSDNEPYGGSYSDFNAFKGTVADYIALTQGGDMPTPQEYAQAVWEHLIGAQNRPAHFYLSDAADMLNAGKSGYDGRVGAMPALMLAIQGAIADIPAASQPTQEQVDAAVAKLNLDVLAAKVAAQIGPILAPLVPTAEQVAAAVVAEEARRLGNG